MTGPGQPCHPIYARVLTEVYQVVRYFLLAIFHASISIGTLDIKISNSTVVLFTPYLNRL